MIPVTVVNFYFLPVKIPLEVIDRCLIVKISAKILFLPVVTPVQMTTKK